MGVNLPMYTSRSEGGKEGVKTQPKFHAKSHTAALSTANRSSKFASQGVIFSQHLRQQDGYRGTGRVKAVKSLEQTGTKKKTDKVKDK